MSRRRRLLTACSGLAALVLGGALASGTASTYAGFTDVATTHARAEAGVWTPDPPTECGPVSSYPGGIVWGTPGNDVLHGGNRPQIIMGLDGNDTIYGGNSGDCLVGGAGDDRLIGGNGKDILIGGPGNDYLSGGNAKDVLDGGPDTDVCDGGNGTDTLVGCELDGPNGPLVTASVLPSIPAPKATTSGTSAEQDTGKGAPSDTTPASPAAPSADPSTGIPPASSDTTGAPAPATTPATADPPGTPAPASNTDPGTG